MAHSTDMARPRVSKQRDALVELLRSSGRFHTAQQLHASLRTSGSSVGLATVYRHLAALSARGEIDCVVRENGETNYRHCSTDHHHHLLCRSCGKTNEIQAPSIEEWCRTTAHELGFTEIAHTLEIVGTCRDCS